MREMVLNHASLMTVEWRKVVRWLPDVADGMAAIVKDGTASGTLRMCRWAHEIQWPDGRSLGDVCRELVRQGARDQGVFLLQKCDTATHLLDGLEQDVKDRFRGCRLFELSGENRVPLVLCAVTNGVAVSVPSEPDWDCDRLPVQFRESQRDGTSEQLEGQIDNLARREHARAIIDRHRAHLRTQCSKPGEVWRLRAQLFPNLLFGPDVEEDLRAVAGVLQTVVNRLAELDDAASAWSDAGGAHPPWPCKVTDESDSVKNHSRREQERMFRSVRGQRKLFTWHARFGDSRMHLRLYARTREVEIGFIGPHRGL